MLDSWRQRKQKEKCHMKAAETIQEKSSLGWSEASGSWEKSCDHERMTDCVHVETGMAWWECKDSSSNLNGKRGGRRGSPFSTACKTQCVGGRPPSPPLHTIIQYGAQSLAAQYPRPTSRLSESSAPATHTGLFTLNAINYTKVGLPSHAIVGVTDARLYHAILTPDIFNGTVRNCSPVFKYLDI